MVRNIPQNRGGGSDPPIFLTVFSFFFYFFIKHSGSSETQNKHIKVFSFMWGVWLACLGLRIILIVDQKLMLQKFLCILMLFTMGKIKVVLIILIMAHRCQICNKKNY